MRSCGMWVMALGVVVAMQLISAGAKAQPGVWELDQAGVSAVVVMPLGESEEAQLRAREVAALLQTWRSVRVVAMPAPVPMPDEARRRAIEELSRAGERAYFYEGAQAARELLEAEVTRLLDDPTLWGGDHEAAAALRVAGLYLTRAYRDMGREHDAKALIARLSAVFVAQSVLGQRWPPEIAALWEEARQQLATYEAWLTVDVQEGWECSLYISGQQIHVKRLRVQPGTRYVVSSRCDGGDANSPPLARELGGLTPGEQSAYYWPFEGVDVPRRAEELAAMARTLGVAEIVLVGEIGRCGANQAGNEGGACVWTSVAGTAPIALGSMDRPTANRALAQGLPEHYRAAGSPDRPVVQPLALEVAPPSLLPWVGSSALMVAGGAWLGYVLTAQHRYNCSAQTGGTSWMSCESTQGTVFTTEEQRLARARSLHVQRLGAGLTLGVGAALLGALIVDRAGTEERQPYALPQLNLSVSEGAAQLGWRGTF